MNTADTVLDIRPTPPKDRFDTIMNAYESLDIGSTMHLIVDHDPRCMYYTLQAMRGDAAFNFEYVEDGPLVWQVLVTRL